MSAKILISACLLGRPIRYNGSAKTLVHAALDRWQAEGRVVPVCPELAAGFSVPRPAAEIVGGDGQAVLRRTAQVLEATGVDVSDRYIDGAQIALALARTHDCRFALLVDGSPSCGSGFIYDGGFSGTRSQGAGVTAALLRANGVEVFSESEMELLQARFP
jgi:uncharacterized protein YbbK (DUF523 family)